MENKTSTIVIANVIIFLLYLKFGSMAFWVPAAAGFCVVAIFIFIMLVLQLYFKEFYNSRFHPFIRKVTGGRLELTEISDEQRVIIRNGMLALALVVAFFAAPFKVISTYW